MKSSFLNRIVKYVFYLIQLGALFFVVRAMLSGRTELIAKEINLRVSVLFYLLILFVFCVIILFIVLAYWHSLRAFSHQEISFSTVVQIYGRTVLAKYIPGNVFHYIGRQVVGGEFNLAQVSIASASLVEVLLITVASTLVALIGRNIVRQDLWTFVPPKITTFIIGFGLLFSFAAIFLISKKRSIVLRYLGFSNQTKLDLREILYAFGFYLLYVVGNGSALIVLHLIFIGSISLPLSFAYIASFSISFLISYLTPGAPGGIGVREALFVLLLSDFSPQSISAFLAIAHRLASLGAQIFYAFSLAPLLNHGVARQASLPTKTDSK